MARSLTCSTNSNQAFYLVFKNTVLFNLPKRQSRAVFFADESLTAIVSYIPNDLENADFNALFNLEIIKEKQEGVCLIVVYSASCVYLLLAQQDIILSFKKFDGFQTISDLYVNNLRDISIYGKYSGSVGIWNFDPVLMNVNSNVAFPFPIARTNLRNYSVFLTHELTSDCFSECLDSINIKYDVTTNYFNGKADAPHNKLTNNTLAEYVILVTDSNCICAFKNDVGTKITTIYFCPDSFSLLLGFMNGEVFRADLTFIRTNSSMKLWKLSDLDFSTIHWHAAAINTIQSTDSFIYTAGKEGIICSWNINNKLALNKSKKLPMPIIDITLLPTNRIKFRVVISDLSVYICDLTSGTQTRLSPSLPVPVNLDFNCNLVSLNNIHNDILYHYCSGKNIHFLTSYTQDCGIKQEAFSNNITYVRDKNINAITLRKINDWVPGKLGYSTHPCIKQFSVSDNCAYLVEILHQKQFNKNRSSCLVYSLIAENDFSFNNVKLLSCKTSAKGTYLDLCWISDHEFVLCSSTGDLLLYSINGMIIHTKAIYRVPSPVIKIACVDGLLYIVMSHKIMLLRLSSNQAELVSCLINQDESLIQTQNIDFEAASALKIHHLMTFKEGVIAISDRFIYILADNTVRTVKFKKNHQTLCKSFPRKVLCIKKQISVTYEELNKINDEQLIELISKQVYLYFNEIF